MFPAGIPWRAIGRTGAAGLLLVLAPLAARGDARPAQAPGSERIVSVQLESDFPDADAGRVTSDPPGIDCPGTCSARFAAGQAVTLTAEGRPNFAFVRWRPLSDGVSCDGPRCSVARGGSEALAIAEFRATHALKVVPAGDGTVVSAPPGIGGPTPEQECSYRGSDLAAGCRSPFPAGTQVTLTATADAGSRFVGWSHWRCRGARRTCRFSIDSAGHRTITAMFTPPRVILDKPRDDVTVTSVPPGIACGAGCSRATARFPYGQRVELRLTSTSAEPFRGWSNCEADGTTCKLEMYGNRWVQPLFGDDSSSVPPQQRYAVTVERSGSGRVTGSGISCGRRCVVEEKGRGERIALVARASRNRRFAGWTRPCGKRRVCRFRVDERYTFVRARFRRR